MTHLWIRAEQRDNEQRVGLTPQGASALLALGFRVTVEESRHRALPLSGYKAAGCQIVRENSWPAAPQDAIIFGLKELPDDGSPLPHRHIMFGHAYKGQPAGQTLLRRFVSGGGTLYDLEYLTDQSGRRVAAFGYWAGYAGAGVAVKCWAAQQRGGIAGPIDVYPAPEALQSELRAELAAIGPQRPSVIVIGALGRVGAGAIELCESLGLDVTRWDVAETAHGGPFPEVLAHDIFLNAILAKPGCPVFAPASILTSARRLGVIGDIACDPTSDFSPVKVYNHVTSWNEPALRAHATPPLDVTAIDNLPALLPVESSEDFASQLLPSLASLDAIESGVWARAQSDFLEHIRNL